MIEIDKRYINQRLIGKGAYGEVFVATDSTLNRQVAIKRYFKSASDLVNVVSALENWSKLNHPHIAQVLDYSDQDGQLSLMMTYCSNASLDQGVSALKSDQGKVARLFVQIASAVAYMHEKGLIHRDLKLANVLLDSTNSPVLIDFDLSIRDGSTEIGKMAGTPCYMAPELLDGSAPSSRATDQYALGIMLFEMLSGNLVSLKPDTNSGDHSDRSFVLNSAIPRHRDWNAVIAKATNIDPKARYTSVSDFSDDVEKLLAGRQISARVQSRVERISLWVRKNPSTGALLSVIAGSLILGFLITSFSWSRTTSARKLIVSNTVLLKQRIEEAKLRKDELTSLLTTVQQELTLAENAEREQQQATQAAQASQERWRDEAERAKLLTAELDSLLLKAKASTKSVVTAQKRSDSADARLRFEQQKLNLALQQEHAQKLSDVWNAIINNVPKGQEAQKWETASRLFELLPRESSGIAHQIISNALANRISYPRFIQLGKPRKQFPVVDVFEKKSLQVESDRFYTDTYSFREPCPDSISFWKPKSNRDRSYYAFVKSPNGGGISFSISLPNENTPKIHGLLADGALLVSDDDVCYVVTFAPQNYDPWKINSPREKMNPEIEKKIEATLIPLSKPQGNVDSTQPPKAPIGNPTQVLVTKGKPSPPGLDPSEVKAWEYCGSIAAQVQLSSNNRNIISIQSNEKAAFDHHAFSELASLSRLTYAYFAYSGITDQCLASLAKCTELQVLELASTVITDAGVQELNSLGLLKSLNISNTQASLEGIDSSLLGYLEYLRMNGTKLGPSRLSKLASCKNLLEIDFTGINVQDSDLAVLKNLSSLNVLTISGRDVSLEGIDESLLKNLRHLNLDSVSLGPSRLSKLVACKNLTDLGLRSMDVNDQDLVVLGHTPMLKVLRVSNAPITDKGIDILESKKDLRIIRLQDTSVSLERVEQLRKKLPKCEAVIVPSASSLLPHIDQKGAWYFHAMESSVGSMKQSSGRMTLEMKKLGPALWHLQVYSRAIALTEGGKYRVVLSARSESSSTVELEAGQASGKYSSVGLRERIALTPEFKRYEFSFTVKGQGQEKSRVGLLLGLGLGTVEIQSFELYAL